MQRRSLASGIAGALAASDAATAAGAAPPEPLAFDHVSVHVADFDRAMAWWQEKLGFRPEHVWRVSALGGARLAYLARGDARVELVEAGRNSVRQPAAADFPDHFAVRGYGHVCFRVEGIDAALAGLAADGVPTRIAARTHDLEGIPYRRRIGFARDPEGDVIEFAEPLRRA